MACHNPIWRHNAKGQLVPTPCRLCHGCRIQRITEFSQRFKLDFKQNGYLGSFITLTYRDDTLPLLLPIGSAVQGDFFKGLNKVGATLYKPDLKKFLDNLNHKVKKKFGWKIKYIACGEYGDDGKRPHYHATIIGLPPSERKLVYDTWNKGRIDIKPINNGAVSYVCGYIMQEVKCPDNLYQYWGDLTPQFALFSKGLGTDHFISNPDCYDQFGKLNLTNNGDKQYQLNSYYRKKFGFLSDTNFDSDLFQRAKKNDVHYFQQLQKENFLAEEKLIHEQRARNKSIHNTLDIIPTS